MERKLLPLTQFPLFWCRYDVRTVAEKWNAGLKNVFVEEEKLDQVSKAVLAKQDGMDPAKV